MITTIFNKSRPFNFVLIFVFLVLCYFSVQLNEKNGLIFGLNRLEKISVLIILVGSLLLTNFIAKKNALIKNNTYPLLFFFSFILLLPTSLEHTNLIITNFFIILAIRRLISLQSLLHPKEKIFDASLYIFFASLFHFWSILYIILVFFSIILHVSRDFRNWFLPYIAFFAVLILASLFSTFVDYSLVDFMQNSSDFSLSFNYFDNRYQNIALSIFAAFAVLFFFSQLLLLGTKSLNTQSSFKKIILSFFIGVVIFVISPNKTNALLLFTFMPLSIMATSYFENETTKWKRETTAIIVIALSLTFFILQL